MRSPLTIAIAVILVFSGCSQRDNNSLSFQLLPGWKLDHETATGLHFYTLSGNPPSEGSFMLSEWPPPTRPEEIPTVVQGLADSYIKQAPRSGIVLANRDYRIENFNGTDGQGSFALFQINNNGTNITQTWFMLSIGGRVWNGQFLGSSNGWGQALTMLKTVLEERQQ